MIPYPLAALISIVIFQLVHIFARKTESFNAITHGRFLSMGGGIATSYVFIDLLPKLAKSELLIQGAISGLFPFFERHVYVMALAGFLLFFTVDRSRTICVQKTAYWLSLSSFAFFNFLVGYAVVDKDNPEVQPLVLFTVAMALHYFVTDYSLHRDHGRLYEEKGRWILVVSLFLGWLVGVLFTLEQTSVALMSAFIGGGVIMNVMRHELPEANPRSLGAFLLASVLYAALLLSIG